MAVNDYHLTFEDRGTYLYAHLTGEDSFAASLSYWNEIGDQVKKLGHDSVLVHETLEGAVNEAELFDVILDVVPSGIGIRVALFDENHDDAKINELGQLFASNRGAILRVFSSLQDAEEWIATGR